MATKLDDNPTQRLICVDARGMETGRIVDRKTGHSTPGVKHLAIQVLVFNSKKELILHERPVNKVGGGMLDAPTTHVLAGEKPADSALRCLRNEYGITKKLRVTVLGGYSYEKDYGDGSSENEYCLAAFVMYDGLISPGKEHAARVVNVPAKKVIEDLQIDKKKYTVWLRETVFTVRNFVGTSTIKERRELFG